MSLSKEKLKSEIEKWIVKQMPIIQMHGGTSVVSELDTDEGLVVIELGGTCSDCGVSDITADNMKRDLYYEFDQIDEVQIKVPSTGNVGSSTVEGGRGGDIEYSTDSAEHL
jgi:Fe-S cluster biogenesis protein NfuA